jgi:hypothetical protein
VAGKVPVYFNFCTTGGDRLYLPEPMLFVRVNLRLVSGFGKDFFNPSQLLAPFGLKDIPQGRAFVAQNPPAPTEGFQEQIEQALVISEPARRFFAVAPQFDHLFEGAGQLAPFDCHASLLRGNLYVGRRLPHHVSHHRTLVFDVLFALPSFHFEKRRLRDVHVPGLNQVRHLPVEEGQEQRADVRAVNVRVGHENDFVVAELAQIKIIFPDAGAERGDEGLNLAVAEHLVEAGLFNI